MEHAVCSSAKSSGDVNIDQNLNYTLPTIAIPNSELSNVIKSNILKPYYPACFRNVFPKPKIVRDFKQRSGEVQKVIVLDPSSTFGVDESESSFDVIDIDALSLLQ